jgi:transposase-like protein
MSLVSYRDFVLVLHDCGVEVDHSSIVRWTQAGAQGVDAERCGVSGRSW